MIETICSIIGTILYPLFSIIFVCVDGVQNLFNIFAGIGDGVGYNGTTITSGQSGTETDTGLLYYLLNSSVVKNLIFSIAILGLFLIIIFTAMAFIKNVYSAKPKTWQDIIGSAIKGLANFIFLPVCCLLGIWLGNILLGAINGATSSSGSSLMSRKLFIAAAYNANHVRNLEQSTDGTYSISRAPSYARDDLVIIINACTNDNIDVNTKFDEETRDRYAQLIDEVFTNPIDKNDSRFEDLDGFKSSEGMMSIYEYYTVSQYYSLWEINYLVLVVGGIFMLYVLGSLTFAMVRRMFILLSLYVISPGLCALYPLDDGKAVGGWKSEFIKTTISAYGAVAGLNIFFSLLPLVDKIEFGNAVNNAVLGSIYRLFITVVGLFCVKEIIGLISGYIGAEDAYGKGAGMMTSTTKKVKDLGTKTVKGAFRYGTKAVNEASKGGNVFAKTARFNHSILTTALGDVNNATFKSGMDAIKEGQKQGKTEIEDARKRDSLKKLQKDLGDGTLTPEKALGYAKGMGYEKDLAEKIAAKENEKAWKTAYARGGDLKSVNLTTADKLLEEQKNMDTLKDAAGTFDRAAKALVNQKSNSGLVIGAMTSLNVTDAYNRFSDKRKYTDEEIQAVLDSSDIDKEAKADEMRTVNEEIEKVGEATGTMKSAAMGMRESMVAVGKAKSTIFANGDYKDQFKKENIDALLLGIVEDAKNATSAADVEAIKMYTDGSGTARKLDEFETEIKAALDAFSKDMGDNVKKLKPQKTDTKK